MEQLPLPIGLPDHMALPVLTFRHFSFRKQQQIQRHVDHGQPAPELTEGEPAIVAGQPDVGDRDQKVDIRVRTGVAAGTGTE
jgi:hypothetical protein